MRKKYNTPHRRHVVKTRMTDEEYADFTGRLAAYEISQSEFIRQAIRKATIRPIVTVSPVNDGLLAALSKLTAEYGKIGGNLNQIARSLNEYGSPYRGLEKEVRGAAADLAALKFEVLQKVGEAVGDTQTYQLKKCQLQGTLKNTSHSSTREFTMKPTARRGQASSYRGVNYRISSLNCGGEDFAVACMRSISATARTRHGRT